MLQWSNHSVAVLSLGERIEGADRKHFRHTTAMIGSARRARPREVGTLSRDEAAALRRLITEMYGE